jgi:hypothetical protein
MEGRARAIIRAVKLNCLGIKNQTYTYLPNVGIVGKNNKWNLNEILLPDT